MFKLPCILFPFFALFLSDFIEGQPVKNAAQTEDQGKQKEEHFLFPHCNGHIKPEELKKQLKSKQSPAEQQKEKPKMARERHPWHVMDDVQIGEEHLPMNEWDDEADLRMEKKLTSETIGEQPKFWTEFF
ncbi:hypothetical protein niasHT_003694 [Heterodera trifolii]|uniref:Uncharacterized protein n=1 Tax=Heterodera trifolii TaxID=157864 RepID=A0ABD2MAE2_9BILA